MIKFLSSLAVVVGLLWGSSAWALEDTKSVTVYNAVTANNTGASAILDVSRYDSVGIGVDITNTATVSFEARATPDGTFRAIRCTNVSDGNASTSVTASAVLQCPTAGMSEMRLPLTNCSSCTVTVRTRITTAKLGNGGGGAGIQTVTAFPTSPFTGQLVVVTDDSAVGACDSAAGSSVTLCRWNGSNWVALGDGTSSGGTLAASDIDTSAELDAIVTDDTGSGALVFGTSPTIGTPTITTPTINGTISGTAAILSTGASVARTLIARFSTEMSIEDRGAVCDGATDDSTAIQETIDLVGALGGTVWFPQNKVCAIAVTLIQPFNNVLLQGYGAGAHRAGTTDIQTASSALKWTGAAAGTMLDFGPLAGATYNLKGGGIDGLFFDGNTALAGTGVLLRSVWHGSFTNLTIHETSVVGLDMDTEETLITDAPDLQSNWIHNIVVVQQGADAGIGIRTGGGGGGNVSLNHFGTLRILHKSGTGLEVGQADNNSFDHVTIFRAAPDTGIGVVLKAGATNEHARYNTFVSLEAGRGGLKAEGFASNTVASQQNNAMFYSRANGTPAPTTELGASFSYFSALGQSRISRDDAFALSEVHRATNTAAAVIGKFQFGAYDSGGAEQIYGYIDGLATDPTAGAEQGTIRFNTTQAGAATTIAQISDGMIIGVTPSGGMLGVGTINILNDYYKDGAALTGIETVTYSANMALDQRLGATHLIIPTNGNGFTIGNPAHDLAGDKVTVIIDNTFGTLGTATFNAVYKLESAWVQPAINTQRSITFLNDGTNLREVSRTIAAGAGLGDITDVNAGTGIIVTNPTGPAPTVTWAPETQVANTVHFDGSQATRTDTINLSGTDVVWNYSSGIADLTGTLKQGGVSVATLSGAQALTNKDIDSEATGNTITIPYYWDFDLVAVVSGVADHVWNDDPLGTSCTPLAAIGTNRATGYCTFPDSDGEFGRQITKYLPTGWTGSFDAEIWWKTTGSGNARFQVAVVCYADNEADDASFVSVSKVTAAAGTSGRPNKQTMTGITTTGCAAGELMRIRFFRDRTEASDTLNAALDVEKVIFIARVAH